MKKLNSIPKIAIVGRPNVGKSSIYNRIIGKRESIINPTPGVTRNRHYHNVNYNNYNFTIIDTGGITEDINEDDFSNIVRIQTEIAIEEADLILLVVESQLTKDDYIIGDILRKYVEKLILLVNKCDNINLEYNSVEAYKLNIGKPIPISASHGTNFDALMDNIILKIPMVNNINENKQLVNIAIVGKPNVGKSTLINKIIGWERSLVSDIPGTTRDSISVVVKYKNYNINFIDTAGIRKKTKVIDSIEYYSVNRAIKSIEKSDIAIHLIDSCDNITEQDKKIIAVAVNRGKTLIIAVNKWDVLDKNASFPKYVDYLRFRFAISKFIPVINISAKTGANINKLLDKTINIYNEASRRISTSELNSLLEKAQHKYIPSTKRGRLKIYYGTQITSSPPKFLLFINRKDLFTKNYKDYLINQIRQEFSFSGVPILIYTKKHR